LTEARAEKAVRNSGTAINFFTISSLIIENSILSLHGMDEFSAIKG